MTAIFSSIMAPLKDELQLMSKKTDIDELLNAWAGLDNKVCDMTIIDGATNPYKECRGRTMVIDFDGGNCEIDRATKMVTCVKPHASMTILPPRCTHVMIESSVFCDKECKIEKELGFTQSKVIKEPQVVYENVKDFDMVPDLIESVTGNLPSFGSLLG